MDQLLLKRYRLNNYFQKLNHSIVLLFVLGVIGCGGGIDSSNIDIDLDIDNPVTVTLSFEATPSTIDSQGTSILTWSSTNANTCQSPDFQTNNLTSGSVNVQPVATRTYVIVCSGSGAGNHVTANITVTVNTGGTSGNTYYVATAPTGNNTQSGSITFPWENIQYGVDQLAPGDTLVINPGHYNETVFISGLDDSGNINASIRILGLDGAVVDGTGLTPSARQGLITIHDASYLIVENLEIANFKTEVGDMISDTPVGILIDGESSNITIKKNNIHHIQNLSTCGESSGCGVGANGIAVYGNTNSAITGLVFEQNEVSSCILASSEAFTLNGNIDGFKLIGNHVHDNNNIGFDFIGYEQDVCTTCSEEQNRVRNGIVRGNRAINNSTNLEIDNLPQNPWYEGANGSAGGFYVDGGRNILFDGNYSSQNDLGFEFASEHSQKSSEDILMINNYVYLNREVGLTIGGYAQSDSGPGGGSASNINVYNNSFYKNKGWGTEISLSFRVINTSFVNNIIYGSSSVSDNYSELSNGQNQNVSWNNNLWWSPDVNDVSGIPGTFILQDPLLLAPLNGNLGLQASSPAINRGLVQMDISHWNDAFWLEEFASDIPAHGSLDINSENRFEGQLDIGADEY